MVFPIHQDLLITHNSNVLSEKFKKKMIMGVLRTYLKPSPEKTLWWMLVNLSLSLIGKAKTWIVFLLPFNICIHTYIYIKYCKCRSIIPYLLLPVLEEHHHIHNDKWKNGKGKWCRRFYKCIITYWKLYHITL